MFIDYDQYESQVCDGEDWYEELPRLYETLHYLNCQGHRLSVCIWFVPGTINDE